MSDILKWFESIDSPLLFLVEINIIIASFGIILLQRIIYAALSLAFVFVNIALFYLILNTDFLAAAQVLIYVGAINVLIIFAVMLVNIKYSQADNDISLGNTISALSSLSLFVVIVTAINEVPFNNTTIHDASSIEQLGITLLTDLLLPFELLSLLLLVALVGSITLARKEI
jgi:NAD(P)H-quinone oxidoreductase subunit 6